MCRVGPWLDGGCVRRLIAENRLWPHATRKEIWSSYRTAVTIGYVACVFRETRRFAWNDDTQHMDMLNGKQCNSTIIGFGFLIPMTVLDEADGAEQGL